MSFVAEHFKALDFFSSNFNLTIMSFCTQGLPGVAESTLEKVKKTSSWRSVTVRAIKSLGESALALAFPGVDLECAVFDFWAFGDF